MFVTGHCMGFVPFLVFRHKEYYRKLRAFSFQVKDQCKVQPRIDHEAQDREERQSSTLSLTGTDFTAPVQIYQGAHPTSLSWE